jgi:hypothetical protein
MFFIQQFLTIRSVESVVLAGHRWLIASNPSYSGGRDQEDCGFGASPGKYFLQTLHKNRAV